MGDRNIDLQHKLYVSCNNIHNNNYSSNKDIGENTFKDYGRLFFHAEWISYYKNNHEGNLFHIWSKKMLSKNIDIKTISEFTELTEEEITSLSNNI